MVRKRLKNLALIALIAAALVATMRLFEIEMSAINSNILPQYVQEWIFSSLTLVGLYLLYDGICLMFDMNEQLAKAKRIGSPMPELILVNFIGVFCSFGALNLLSIQ